MQKQTVDFDMDFKMGLHIQEMLGIGAKSILSRITKIMCYLYINRFFYLDTYQ